MIDKIYEIVEKIEDYQLYGSKKDKRIRTLELELSNLITAIETFGCMDLEEANLEWEPRYHDGDYTIEDRLRDIRSNSIRISQKAHHAKEKLLNRDLDERYYNY